MIDKGLFWRLVLLFSLYWVVETLIVALALWVDFPWIAAVPLVAVIFGVIKVHKLYLVYMEFQKAWNDEH